jgi:hypothetical protein
MLLMCALLVHCVKVLVRASSARGTCCSANFCDDWSLAALLLITYRTGTLVHAELLH